MNFKMVPSLKKWGRKIYFYIRYHSLLYLCSLGDRLTINYSDIFTYRRETRAVVCWRPVIDSSTRSALKNEQWKINLIDVTLTRRRAWIKSAHFRADEFERKNRAFSAHKIHYFLSLRTDVFRVFSSLSYRPIWARSLWATCWFCDGSWVTPSSPRCTERDRSGHGCCMQVAPSAGSIESQLTQIANLIVKSSRLEDWAARHGAYISRALGE